MFTFLFPISYFMLSLLYKIRSNVKEKYDKHRIVQRSVTFVGQGLLYFDRASEIEFYFPIHIHPEYELNYIENAKGAQRIVGDSIEEIEEEELVLVTNPQLEHAWRDYNNKPQNIHEITIQFHSDLLSDQILNRNQMISIRELFHRARKGIVFSRETIAKVRPLLKTLSCENDSFYSLIKLLVILHELSLDKGMRELSTGQFAINSVSKEHTNEKLNKVLDYVHFHFSEVIRLADVAKW